MAAYDFEMQDFDCSRTQTEVQGVRCVESQKDHITPNCYT